MEVAPLPRSKQDALLGSPLYSKFSVEGREEEELVKLFYGGGTLDAWCPRCRQMSVFSIASQLPSYGEPKRTMPRFGLISISAYCGRGAENSYSGCRFPIHIIFQQESDEVVKIGQSPAAAVLAFGALDEAFDKELDEPRRDELGTAIGLHAHGVGIGSFVYLRRIFEALLEEARLLARQEPTWDDSLYEKSRTSERIEMLHSYLPSRLVLSAGLYGGLSAGIHELSERECLDNFPLVQSAIELILKERHEAKRFQQVIKAVGTARERGKLAPRGGKSD
jgi:hypothetical protein